MASAIAAATPVVVIAFVGSVFSPYYYRARQRGCADPLQHTAINVALYGRGVERWAMTERGAAATRLAPTALAIGPSAVAVDDGRLAVTIRERGAPLPRRIEGRVEVTPICCNRQTFALHANGRHEWQPVAPLARIDVRFQRPNVRWQGSAYVDSNGGSGALEDDFLGWHWCRSADASGVDIRYAATDRAGMESRLLLRFDDDGAVTALEPGALHGLGRGLWGVQRSTLNPAPVRIERALEDTPFYTRSVLAVGDSAHRRAVHEQLSLARFSRPWVRTLLPFRMPRVSR